MAKQSLFEKTTPADVDAANEIYKTAQAHAQLEIDKLKGEMEAVRLESQAQGILKKIEYDLAHNEFIKFVVLMRLKDAKEYKKGGMTWAQFCEQIAGEPVRNVDRKINDIRPLVDKLSDKMSEIIGVPFNKIRFLGRQVSDKMSEIKDGVLVVDDIEIPLTPENKDDIEAAIDVLKEAHQKQVEDREATIKAKDRLLGEKEKVIQKQEKEIQRHERRLAERGLAPGEEAFIQDMEKLRAKITMVELTLDPRNMPPDMTPLMTAALIETLGHGMRVLHAHYDEAVTLYGDPEVDGGWTPPTDTPPDDTDTDI